ncbi:hypothetical protein ABEB36_015373 [Hypothenemus hampei]|uniref:THAP-type domain-containing protein n=1 Tax=Hypothenemus hampei TaxID=57062 RepID=A0ABD1E0C2_HYPHA
MSTRVCILCEKRQCDTANSFYSFPKDPMLQAKWKYVCSIEDNVVVNNLKVCSEHFDITAFVETGISGQRGILRLKPGAIPKGITNIETTVNEDNTSLWLKRLEKRGSDRTSHFDSHAFYSIKDRKCAIFNFSVLITEKSTVSGQSDSDILHFSNPSALSLSPIYTSQLPISLNWYRILPSIGTSYEPERAPEPEVNDNSDYNN